MYVCVCHGVSDKDIQKVVKNGVCTMMQLHDVLKVATCCGTCLEYANQCLNEALNEDTRPTDTVN